MIKWGSFFIQKHSHAIYQLTSHPLRPRSTKLLRTDLLQTRQSKMQFSLSKPRLLSKPITTIRTYSHKAKNFKSFDKQQGYEGEKTKYVKAYQSYCEGRQEEALTMLDTIPSHDPEYPMVPTLKGRIYTMRGEYPRALEFLNQALELNDKNPYAYYYMGTVYDLQNQLDKAIQALEDALDADSTFVLARAELASFYFKKGEYSHCLYHAEECLKSEPDLEQAILWKAKAERAMDRLDDAKATLSDLDKIAELHEVQLYSLLGEIEYDLGNYKEAKDAFIKVIRENEKAVPDSAIIRLADIHTRDSNFHEALKILQKRIVEEDASAHPIDNPALLYRTNGDILVKIGLPEEASYSYSQSIRIEPNQLHLYVKLIFLALEVRNYDLAINSATKGLELWPYNGVLRKLKITALLEQASQNNSIPSLLEHKSDIAEEEMNALQPWRVRILLAEGQKAEAAKLFNSISASKFDALGTITLAQAALSLDHIDAAEALLMKLVKRTGLAKELREYGGYVAVQNGLYEVGSKLYTQLIKENPTEPRNIISLSQVRIQAGRLDAAKMMLDYIAVLLPQDARSFSWLGDYATMQEDYIAALQLYKKAKGMENPVGMSEEAAIRAGITLIRLHKYNDAMQEFEDATEIKMSTTGIAFKTYAAVLNGEAVMTIGVDVPQEYNDYKMAERLMNHALAANILRLDRVGCIALLARIKHNLKEQTEAEKLLQQAISLNPKHPEIELTQSFLKR